ncbi:hypothetical protein L1049_002020 [Liquidambar formosana]|uniref:Uncharacterized protein n=1 Tax=Liquidambar formosana TaxID=63359 RepID=A0AAP0NGI2_LIQFO
MARRETNGRDYWGKQVDESMIVLRMRIWEMKMLNTSHAPPSNWMEWEKRYYSRYGSDVCEAMGLLQSYLMKTRPSLALGMVALIVLSVPISTMVVMYNAIDIARVILSKFL